MLEQLRWSKPWQRLVAMVLSFAVSLAFWCVLDSFLIAAIIMGSVAAHEIAHLAMSWRYGIKGGIVFLPLVGITYSAGGYEPEQHRKRVMVWVYLAGPICSLLLGSLSLAIGISTYDSRLLILAIINLWLTLFNLAPGMGTDGQLIVGTIDRCPTAKRSKKAARILNLTGIGALIGTYLLTNSGRIDYLPGAVAIIFFTLNLLSRQSHRKHKTRPTPGGLTESEATRFALIYSGLVFATLVILWIFPIP